MTATSKGLSMKHTSLPILLLLLLLAGCADEFLSTPAPRIQRIFFTQEALSLYGWTPPYVGSINMDGMDLRIFEEDSSRIHSSPAGGKMAYIRYTTIGTDVVVADTDGSHRIVIDSVRGVKGGFPEIGFRSDALSPDGKTVAYYINDAGRGGRALWLSDIDGGNKRQIQLGSLLARSAAQFSPDSRSLAIIAADDGSYFSSGDLYIIDIGTITMRKVLDSAYMPPSDGLAWSPKGDMIAFFKAGTSSTNVDSLSSQVAILDLSSGNVRSITSSLYYPRPYSYGWVHSGISWSPDGRHLAFCSGSFGNKYDLWMVDTSGANLRNLSNTPELREDYSHWSSDGKEILYTSYDPNGAGGTFLKRFDITTGKETIVAQNAFEGFWEQ
jgi:tricorn protease-like protein